MDEQLWLVGAGRMARAYVEVLAALGKRPLVICRSQASADRFASETGLDTIAGGVEAALLREGAAPQEAIVAIDVAELTAVLQRLLTSGCKRILAEKPGGLNLVEITATAALAEQTGGQVWLAYNRRFYGSVLAARRGLAEDGGAISMTFDFTEAADSIVKIGHRPDVLNEWLLANSTHVIDTAFMLAGAPTEWRSLVEGRLDWHPRGARFAGHGATEAGVLFSYLADWDAPGRWSIEISSRKRRFILRPMEQLQIQKRGSFVAEAQPPEDDLDARFKPGLYRQTMAFLSGEGADLLPTMGEHRERLRTIYAPMLTTQNHLF